MSVAEQVLARAAARIGYYAPDDPQPGSEAGRYWAARTGQQWLAGPSDSVWWCMLFVSMCLDECGQIDAIGGFSFNTDYTVNKVRQHPDAYFVSVYDAQPGDVVIYDWDGGGTDHVGFVEKNLGGGTLQTIEGNTSSGSYGSQSAGNGVWRRVRNQSIAYVIRPAYTDSPSNTAPAGPLTSVRCSVQSGRPPTMSPGRTLALAVTPLLRLLTGAGRLSPSAWPSRSLWLVPNRTESGARPLRRLTMQRSRPFRLRSAQRSMASTVPRQTPR